MTLGLAAGIAPGPLSALIISETLKGNRKNGVLIAMVPLLTDLPIVVFSILFIQSISNTGLLLGSLSILGGVFLIYLAIKNFSFVPESNGTKSSYRSSVKYGIIANILSPHPYLFWITIGAPTFIKAGNSGATSSYVFIAGFYLLLVSSKAMLAIASSKVKGILSSAGYKITMKLLGLMLLILSGVIIYEGYVMIWNAFQ